MTTGNIAPDVTVTVALATVPPQFTLYEVVDVGDTEVEPDVAPPVEKLVPVQLVAMVLDHVRVDDAPDTMVVGLADSDAVGALTVTVTDALATAPEQLTV